MITFSKSEVDKFQHQNKSLRWGQAFYNHMKLSKVTSPQDREFCDRLFVAPEEKAKAMVQSRTVASQ